MQTRRPPVPRFHAEELNMKSVPNPAPADKHGPTTILDVVEFKREETVPLDVEIKTWADVEKYAGTGAVFSTNNPLAVRTLEEGFAAREEADAAYYPARDFYGRLKQFRNLWQLKRFLEAHPKIRTRNPSPKRLEIHVGDWCAQLGSVDPFDLPGDLIDRFYAQDEAIRKARADARRRQPSD
jgi:hypothetical protein